MTTLLEQLSTMTTIVADTGDLTAIARLKPVDATTNPSLITKALTEESQQARLNAALVKHEDIDATIDALTVEIGCDILGLITGRVSTEVDARLSYDTAATVAKAHEFMDAYAAAGFDNSRILIKIAATWQGIQAARQLEKDGIHCNLTLLFGMHQAKACADAGVTLISPFVGRILDWQKAHEARDSIPISEDMGVKSVQSIYNYYKQHGYTTQVMGASFRSTEQIKALAGCDLLTISPALLDALAAETGTLTQALSTLDVTTMTPPSEMTEAAFAAAMESDPITTALLPKGIDGFIKARDELTAQLAAIQ